MHIWNFGQVSFVSFFLMRQNSRGWEKIKNTKSQPMSYISFRVLCITLTSDHPNFCCFLEWKVIKFSWTSKQKLFFHFTLSSWIFAKDYFYTNELFSALMELNLKRADDPFIFTHYFLEWRVIKCSWNSKQKLLFLFTLSSWGFLLDRL